MSKYAVGFISYHDNVLTVDVVEAESWKQALAKHTDDPEMETYLPEDMEEAKGVAFDMDCMFDVKEIFQ